MHHRFHHAVPTALALAAAFFGLVLAGAALPGAAHAQVQIQPRTRSVVLRFEGWRADQARRAAIRGLAEAHDLVEEDQLIETASQIGVDVSSPEGMAAVVEHLGVTLVIGGFVEGTGRRSTTTIWVMDVRGNELTRRTTTGPSSRSATQDIGAAATDAAAEALATIHRPEPVVDPGPELPPEHDVVETAPEHHMIEETDVSGRWNQPLVRALVGLRLRNRSASVAPNAATNRFDADMFPDIQIMAEVRPLSRAPGAERGLYFGISGGFSAGLSYFRLDGAQRDMMTYNFELDAGYGLVLAEMAEIVLSAGFGIDGFDLSDGGLGDFPSVTYTFIRPAIQGRIRIVPDHLLVAEVGFGGRIVVDSGPIQILGPDGTSNGGIDFFLGLAGTIDPGFSWAVRFAYQSYFLGFSGNPGATSGTDEAIQIWLMVGWSF